MALIKKYWKLLLFLLVVILAFLIFLNHAHKHGAKYVFDMKEINGVSDNNPYGIRNDVYDFVKKDLDKPENKFLNDPKVKNLILNYVKGRLMEIKYFSDQEKSVEISRQTITIYNCLYINKDEKVYEYISSYVSNPDGDQETSFNKVFFTTKDHKIISRIIDSYFSDKSLNPSDRNPLAHPELCERYYYRVLNDEDFHTKDPKTVDGNYEKN